MQSLINKILALRSRLGTAVSSSILGRMWRRSLRVVLLSVSNFTLRRFGVLRLAGISLASMLLVCAAAYFYVSDVKPISIASRAADSAVQSMGFGVELHVSGAQMTHVLQVRDALGGDSVKSLLGVDVHEARERIEALPWVASAQIKKQYPQLLKIELEEKLAFAVWQSGHELSVIERSGDVIAPLVAGTFSELPFLVGPGADRAAGAFLKSMEDFPRLQRKVGAYVRVAERRWDLNLVNGVVVKLPSTNSKSALLELSQIDSLHGILDRDVEVIDYRLPDRVALRLSVGADARRVAALEERMQNVRKLMKSRGARL